MTRKKYLHKIFREKGAIARKFTRQCIGLIPEICRLRIYEAEGFGSIYEYAAKLAGVSRLQVDTVLRLEQKFQNKPALKEALVSGEISHHKLARVASIATEENQEDLAAKAKLLPKSALDVFVKDVKYQNPNGLHKPLFDRKCLPGQTFEEEVFLNEKVKEKLLEMQKKGMDINEILLEMLEQREQQIEQEKEDLAEEQVAARQKSRYIPAKIRKILKKEYGKKCSIPKCGKAARIIHHTQRYSLTQNHNPYYLAPVCHEHHLIAHTLDVRLHEKRRL